MLLYLVCFFLFAIWAHLHLHLGSCTLELRVLTERNIIHSNRLPETLVLTWLGGSNPCQICSQEFRSHLKDNSATVLTYPEILISAVGAIAAVGVVVVWICESLVLSPIHTIAHPSGDDLEYMCSCQAAHVVAICMHVTGRQKAIYRRQSQQNEF